MYMKAQSKWSWEIAAYLFLAGLGGGAYLAGVIVDFLPDPEKWEIISKIGVFLGPPSVALGCLFLLVDLGLPANAWRAAMRPGTSWIARGTIIIVVFMALGAVHIALWIWPFRILEDMDGVRSTLGVLGSIFAIGTMIYTGILLGAARPIAFWSTAMLPLLFLVSAISTGIMAIIVVGSIMRLDHESGLASLAKADILIVILEIFVIGFYLQSTHRVTESRASAELVLSGAVSGLFWFGVALLGLLIPLVLELLGSFALSGTGAGAATVIASICGIIGGFILRQVVLRGGILSPLKAGRFVFAVPCQD